MSRNPCGTLCPPSPPLLDICDLAILARGGRKARVTELKILCPPIQLPAQTPQGRARPVAVGHTRHRARTIGRPEAVEWRLITTVATRTLEDALGT